MMVARVLTPEPDQKLSSNQDLGVKVATPVGTLIGQLLFGWLADVVGRKRMYGVELMIIIIATFGQSVSGEAHAVNVLGVLIVWRGLVSRTSIFFSRVCSLNSLRWVSVLEATTRFPPSSRPNSPRRTSVAVS